MSALDNKAYFHVGYAKLRKRTFVWLIGHGRIWAGCGMPACARRSKSSLYPNNANAVAAAFTGFSNRGTCCQVDGRSVYPVANTNGMLRADKADATGYTLSRPKLTSRIAPSTRSCASNSSASSTEAAGPTTCALQLPKRLAVPRRLNIRLQLQEYGDRPIKTHSSPEPPVIAVRDIGTSIVQCTPSGPNS